MYIRLKNYLRLLRVHQYIKNFFIFAPLVFALELNNPHLVIKCSIAFICFSLAASSVYIFNDYCDIESDRKHITKKNRPLASGAVSIKSAMILMSFLTIISIVIMFFISVKTAFILLLYFLLNILYSIDLKHRSIIDITIIGLFFILRLLAGSFVTNIQLTHWILLITFLLSIFLALAKRRDDLISYMNTGEKLRKVIDGYSLEFINCSMGVMSSVVIVSYVLYTMSDDIINKFHTNYLYITSFFVILGVLRYLQITFVFNRSGDPTKIFLTDKPLILLCICWLLCFMLIIYL